MVSYEPGKYQVAVGFKWPPLPLAHGGCQWANMLQFQTQFFFPLSCSHAGIRLFTFSDCTALCSRSQIFGNIIIFHRHMCSSEGHRGFQHTCYMILGFCFSFIFNMQVIHTFVQELAHTVTDNTILYYLIFFLFVCPL